MSLITTSQPCSTAATTYSVLIPPATLLASHDPSGVARPPSQSDLREALQQPSRLVQQEQLIQKQQQRVTLPPSSSSGGTVLRLPGGPALAASSAAADMCPSPIGLGQHRMPFTVLPEPRLTVRAEPKAPQPTPPSSAEILVRPPGDSHTPEFLLPPPGAPPGTPIILASHQLLQEAYQRLQRPPSTSGAAPAVVSASNSVAPGPSVLPPAPSFVTSSAPTPNMVMGIPHGIGLPPVSSSSRAGGAAMSSYGELQHTDDLITNTKQFCDVRIASSSIFL